MTVSAKMIEALSSRFSAGSPGKRMNDEIGIPQ